ncbi:uncharacterized protein LOC143598429 [Bidens hawaiensis]|uniref:uncharacterized protein LOC143598429 n=1 Tax=Bidens hawaiensis TaxID=980011 RepID=UPI0040496FF1
MPPFVMLYGRRCRTSVCWGEIGHKEIESLEVVQETSLRFDHIKARMKVAQDHQKSNANKRQRPIQFNVGEVTYKLDLPDELEGIYSTFHVSHLRKCLADEMSHVLLIDIEVDEQLNYIEEPADIVGRNEKQLRRTVMPLV